MTAIGVLGPLLPRGPNGPIPLPSTRQRRLLVGLVAHLGSAVAADELIDLVCDDPPAHPAGAVHTNIARLRRPLPPGLRIETTPEGYRLLADRSAVDATAFTDHLAAARIPTRGWLRGHGVKGQRPSCAARERHASVVGRTDVPRRVTRIGPTAKVLVCSALDAFKHARRSRA